MENGAIKRKKKENVPGKYVRLAQSECPGLVWLFGLGWERTKEKLTKAGLWWGSCVGRYVPGEKQGYGSHGTCDL